MTAAELKSASDYQLRQAVARKRAACRRSAAVPLATRHALRGELTLILAELAHRKAIRPKATRRRAVGAGDAI